MAWPPVFLGVANGPAPDATVIDIGRENRGPILRGAVAGWFFGLSAVSYVLFPNAVAVGGHASTTERVIATLIALLILGITQHFTRLAPKALRRLFGLAFDAQGLWFRDGDNLSMIPWPNIGAAGITGTGRWAVSGVSSLITFLELVPASKRIAAGYPQLKDWSRPGRAPRPNLPPIRFRFPLPTNRAIRLAVGAIEQYAPQLFADPVPTRGRRRNEPPHGQGRAG